MEIKLHQDDFVMLFGSVDIKEGLVLNNVRYSVLEWSTEFDAWKGINDITLNLIPFIKQKSKEELAAEQTVQKAQEALEATKKTLEKIKESK